MTTMTKPEYKTPSDMAEGNATAAAVSAAPLVGTWTNTDAETRGLVKIAIAASGTSISIDAFGACTPTPCNWGTVSGLAYANSVTSTNGVAFSAQYQFGFKNTIVTGHLQDNRLLVVETFDHFTDGSGRSNYYSQYTMHR